MKTILASITSRNGLYQKKLGKQVVQCTNMEKNYIRLLSIKAATVSFQIPNLSLPSEVSPSCFKKLGQEILINKY